MLVLCCCAQLCKAQNEARQASVNGRLLNRQTLQPANDVQVTIPYLKLLTVTAPDGAFSFTAVPFGNYKVVFSNAEFMVDTVRILVNEAVVDLKEFTVAPNENEAIATALPTITLEDDNLSAEDDGVRTANVSGLLTGSRDPFQSAASFVFSPYRFRLRGYTHGQQEVQINAAPVNDIETNDAYWSQWGGLNDVFRSRENAYGLQPSGYGYGGLNGLVYFDATAASQRKQTRVTYSVANRTYTNRLMLTHSTGLLKHGWSFSGSFSKRWAKEGYVPGTFYDSYSYFAAASKKFGRRHELSFTAFGAPTRRGKSAPVIQEVYDLAGSAYYNPNWGYQQGVKRNAKVGNNFQPIFILSEVYTPNERVHWNTALTYQSGKNRNSTLDWYNGRDPRPDYYRYLPGYYAANEKDPPEAEFYTGKQINWDRLYQVNNANTETAYSVDGMAGNNYTGHRSVYAVGEDVDAIKKYTFSTNLQYAPDEHIMLNTGLSLLGQRTESYKQLTDLLGGDYFLNLNQFAAQQNVPDVSFSQYDLDHPNRLIHVGDHYNYDYISRFTKAQLWEQAIITFNRVDFFVAARAGVSSFSREGLFRNGLFANNAKGKDFTYSFPDYGIKGGITYKLNGRNYLFVNAGYGTEAPTFDNTYISPRTHNATVDHPEVKQIGSIEGGYLMRAPKYNVRVVGYVTDAVNGTEIKHFYNDDPAYQTFVNYVMQDVNIRYMGTELALEVKASAQLTATGVLALGQAVYAANPTISIYRDNDTASVAKKREVFVKNAHIASGPQTAATIGFNYRAKKYWYAGINFNYFDRNYVDINPDRRSAEAADLIERNTPLYHRIFDQEQLPSAFTIDIAGGKSIMLSRLSKRLPRHTVLYLNAGIGNLLNTHTATGGFEQLRYDFTDNNPAKFPTKYFYGQGRNFFINLSLKF